MADEPDSGSPTTNETPAVVALGPAPPEWSVVPVHTARGNRCGCRCAPGPSPGKHPRVPWERWMVRTARPAQIGLLVGSMAVAPTLIPEIRVDVVGESAHQDALLPLTGGGRTWSGAHERVQARLEPDAGAATCRAETRGGWERALGNAGRFGVVLRLPRTAAER